MDGDATLPCIGSIPERPVESNLPPGRGFFMFLPSMTDDSGPRFSWEGVKLSVAITATDKRLSQQACFHSSEQLASGLCLDNVAPCAEAKGFLHHLSRRFLSQEDDFRFREKFANLSSGFDSVQTWESAVQQIQPWLPLFRARGCYRPSPSG